MNAPEQVPLEGMPEEKPAAAHMIARVNAMAVKLVFPFMAQNDVRYYLMGINIRPLDDGSIMIVATDGHRYIIVRDPHGYAEEELVVSISKDAIKHMANAKHTLDVMSNGSVIVSGAVAEPLFIQPGEALIREKFPRIERVASVIGYQEGISGAVNPRYLYDALQIGRQFGDSIRFFSRDSDSPLNFVITGLGDLECFGGIMKLRDNYTSLPAWFPRAGDATEISEM